MTRGAKLMIAGLVLLPALIPAAAVAGEGIVALQTAAPSCDAEGRTYVYCGNGTVTDTRTGLIWLRNANCFGELTWQEAMETVVGLSDLDCQDGDPNCDCGLEDGSSPGEWRLPSRKEWRQMVADAVEIGCSNPALTNDFGVAPCWSQDCVTSGLCSFVNVQSWTYWSSSTWVQGPIWAWTVGLASGNTDGIAGKLNSHYLWPVRGGQ